MNAWAVGSVRPNPGERGTIDFSVPTRSRVVMGLLSVAGRRLRQTDRILEQGRYTEPAFSGEIPAGIYFIRFAAYPQSGEAGYRAVRRFVVLAR